MLAPPSTTYCDPSFVFVCDSKTGSTTRTETAAAMLCLYLKRHNLFYKNLESLLQMLREMPVMCSALVVNWPFTKLKISSP